MEYIRRWRVQASQYGRSTHRFEAAEILWMPWSRADHPQPCQFSSFLSSLTHLCRIYSRADIMTRHLNGNTSQWFRSGILDSHVWYSFIHCICWDDSSPLCMWRSLSWFIDRKIISSVRSLAKRSIDSLLDGHESKKACISVQSDILTTLVSC